MIMFGDGREGEGQGAFLEETLSPQERSPSEPHEPPRVRMSESASPLPATVRDGVIAAVLSGALYRVVLTNGMTVLAALDSDARRRIVRLSPKDQVRIRLSPLDYSRGRILAKR